MACTLLHRRLSNVAAGADLRLQIDIRVSQLNLANGPGLRDATLTQHLNVHFGEAPLPRFDANWAYGDLHYHSQGTDNEGESAHAHRGVLHAMGALGLDFTFATEHASGGEQITDISEIPIGFSFEGVLRDSNALRFRWLLAHLNGQRGANADAASSMLTGTPPGRRSDRCGHPEVDIRECGDPTGCRLRTRRRSLRARRRGRSPSGERHRRRESAMGADAVRRDSRPWRTLPRCVWVGHRRGYRAARVYLPRRHQPEVEPPAEWPHSRLRRQLSGR